MIIINRDLISSIEIKKSEKIELLPIKIGIFFKEIKYIRKRPWRLFQRNWELWEDRFEDYYTSNEDFVSKNYGKYYLDENGDIREFITIWVTFSEQTYNFRVKTENALNSLLKLLTEEKGYLKIDENLPFKLY